MVNNYFWLAMQSYYTLCILGCKHNNITLYSYHHSAVAIQQKVIYQLFVFAFSLNQPQVSSIYPRNWKSKYSTTQPQLQKHKDSNSWHCWCQRPSILGPSLYWGSAGSWTCPILQVMYLFYYPTLCWHYPPCNLLICRSPSSACSLVTLHKGKRCMKIQLPCK